MKKTFKIPIISILLLAIFMPIFSAASENCYMASINKFPKNTIERYSFNESLNNKTSFEYELEKAKREEENIPLATDEYISYITKVQNAGTIQTNLGTFYPVIGCEARVVINRLSGVVTRVENFGQPYATVDGQNADWNGGGFNIDRIDDVTARVSSTGQFLIDNGSLTIGGDIVSVGVNLGAKTRILTIVANMSW